MEPAIEVVGNELDVFADADDIYPPMVGDDFSSLVEKASRQQYLMSCEDELLRRCEVTLLCHREYLNLEAVGGH